MTALDVFVFLLLIGGAAVGFVRGFVHEVISLFAWVVAIAMLKLFHTQLWTGIQSSFHTGAAAGAVLAFAILFVPTEGLYAEAVARHIFETFRKVAPVDIYLANGAYESSGMLNHPANLTVAERVARFKADNKVWINRDIFAGLAASREIEFERKLEKLKAENPNYK